MEKFSLKWNDFQTSASQAFQSLRKEEDFFDVTLVSDDEVHLLAHKLVLSASSNFFKSILKKSSHSNPLIFMNGINSINLQFVLDYIYQGEVQIYQEQLDSFLEVAQTLKVNGLISEQKQESLNFPEKDTVNWKSEEKSEVSSHMDTFFETPKVNHMNTKDVDRKTFTVAIDGQDESEIQSKIDEILTKTDGVITCTACGKSGTHPGNMKRHVQTHIDGLSYTCNICNKSFRSKNSFQNHNGIYHK